MSDPNEAVALATVHLTVAGLGPAGLDQLPAATLRVLETAPRLILRTERHPAAAELQAQGVAFETLDALYAGAESFEALYPRLAEEVLARAAAGPVIYAVPGHPLLGEESVRLALAGARERGFSTRVLSAPSFVDVVASALASASDGPGAPNLVEWQVADGATVETIWWDPTRPTLLFQVDDSPTASRVKLALQEEYPDEWPVYIVRRAGDPTESVLRVPLYALDRTAAGEYDHLTSLYLPPLAEAERRPDFRTFEGVIAQLRAPDGCPWDREQTYISLKRYVLEEAYEVLEAVDADDPAQLCDELGDLLLQVLLYSQIAREQGDFEIRDVIGGITEKMIRRHPHVFGDVEVADSGEVLRNWEAIKQTERGDGNERRSALDGVPKELPALLKALEVSKRVVKVGFEWPTLPDVLAKLDEEVGELKAELETRDRERLSAELGDLLFTVVNVARWLKIDPEEALRQMVARFERRFREVERLAEAGGTPVTELGIEALERLWQQAKLAVT